MEVKEILVLLVAAELLDLLVNSGYSEVFCLFAFGYLDTGAGGDFQTDSEFLTVCLDHLRSII